MDILDILLLALGVGLPLLKFVLFPARAMGRGGNWTLLGALMIVGLMMAIWAGVNALSGFAGDGTAVAQSATGSSEAQQLHDLDALEKLLR
jgi:thiol:disulfide interchange protein